MSSSEKAKPAKEADLDEALEASLVNLPGLLQQRKKDLEQRENELKRAREAFEKENPSFGTPSDVLTLNVGGTCISVLRRTLTCVEGSMLATRFSGRWDDSLEKDKEGNFFIDQPFNLFSMMIDHLRAMQIETPSGPPVTPPLGSIGKNDKQRLDFIRMAEYYGLTLAIYPMEFSMVNCDRTNVELVCQPANYSIDAPDLVTVSLSPASSHRRQISAFEVTLGSFSSAKIGWIGGEHHALLLDCSHSTITGPDGVLGTVHGVSIEEGSILRFEVDGNKWFVNGQLVAFCDSMASNVLQMQTLHSIFGNCPSNGYAACFELKGKCRVSLVEVTL